jgi:hypothetical protein
MGSLAPFPPLDLWSPLSTLLSLLLLFTYDVLPLAFCCAVHEGECVGVRLGTFWLTRKGSQGRSWAERCVRYAEGEQGREKGDKLAGWMDGERGREGMECESGESNYPT